MGEDPPAAADEAAFRALAEPLLAHVETTIADAGFDAVDLDRAADVLTITFESDGDEVRYVLSLELAAARVWLAAEGEGLEFAWQPDDGDWVCPDGRELYSLLADRIGTRTGVTLEF